MSETLDVIKTLASVVSSIAIVVAVLQLRHQRLVWKTHHERSRLERAIEIIRHFNSSINAQWASTYKLVERMTTSQLKELHQGRPFAVSESERGDLLGAIPGTELKTTSGQITLTSEQSYQLRFQALELLNATEIVCQACARDVADRSIIEEEIRFLYNPRAPEPTTLMKQFLSFFSEDNFPAIHKFTSHLDGQRSTRPAPPDLLVTRP